jgi:hypothetical protein
MRFRTTIGLAILVGLLAGYYAWSERGPKPETGNPKLFPFDEKAVLGLSVSHDGTTFALQREGDTWQMTQPVKSKADRGPAAGLVSSLALARIERTLEEKPSNLAEFGLDPPALTVVMKVKDRPQPVTLFLGNNSPTGSWVYAKMADSPAVLLVSASLKSDLAKSPAELRDKTILALDLPKTSRVELKTKDGTIVAAKSGEEWWLEQPIRTKADGFAIERLVGAVRDLKAKEFVTEEAKDLAEYGLARPDYRITVSEKDVATPKTVLIAKKRETAAQERTDRRRTSGSPEPPADQADAYVAVEGHKQVFVVEGKALEELKKTPLDLRDKRLVAFETKDVKRIRLVWPEVTIALEKDGDTWRMMEPEAAAAESGKAMDLLYSINGLRFNDVASEKPGDLSRYGLTKPQVEVSLQKADNTDLPAIEFGRVDKEKNQLFAKVKTAPTVYILEPRVLDELPRDPAKLKKADSAPKKP